MPEGGRWAASVAAYGLQTHRTVPIEPLANQEWTDLLTVVRSQRIWGFLNAAISKGGFPCTDLQAAEVQVEAAHAIMVDMAVEARMLQVSTLFQDGGIDHRILKGTTTARRVYPRIGLRSFCDVDVLVPGESVGAAVQCLQRLGGKRRFDELFPGFDRRFSKGPDLAMPDGISVDLHRTFVLGPYGFTVDLPGIFARYASVLVGDREVPCLDLLDAAIHACMHAVLGNWPPRLVPVRDVAQFLSDPRIELAALLQRAAEWHCHAVVARAIALAKYTYGFPDSPLLTWSADYTEQRWERRALAVYGAGHTYTRQAIAAVGFIPAGQRRLFYVLALGSLAPIYLRERTGSILSSWRT